MEKVQFTVDAMTCNGCAAKIKSAVKNAGATAVTDLETKTVEVEFDSNAVSLDAIKTAIMEKGYEIA